MVYQLQSTLEYVERQEGAETNKKCLISLGDIIHIWLDWYAFLIVIYDHCDICGYGCECEIDVIHYNDAIMGTMASQITSLTIVYLTVYSRADQRKHQSFASLAFVREFQRWPVNSPHKGRWRRKCFHLMTPSWKLGRLTPYKGVHGTEVGLFPM